MQDLQDSPPLTFFPKHKMSISNALLCHHRNIRIKTNERGKLGRRKPPTPPHFAVVTAADKHTPIALLYRVEANSLTSPVN